MGFYKNHPFMASPGAETSDIIKNVPLLASYGSELNKIECVPNNLRHSVYAIWSASF